VQERAQRRAPAPVVSGGVGPICDEVRTELPRGIGWATRAWHALDLALCLEIHFKAPRCMRTLDRRAAHQGRTGSENEALNWLRLNPTSRCLPSMFLKNSAFAQLSDGLSVGAGFPVINTNNAEKDGS